MPDAYDSRPETYEHIGVVRSNISLIVIELLYRANEHDASKLVDPEKDMFDEYTPKLKHTTFGSEEYKGYLASMGEALQHHYEHNRHHPEHHGEAGIAGMNLIDLVEMICDWHAATKRHDDGDIMRSIEQNQDRFGYSDEVKAILRNTAVLLEAAYEG